MSFNRQPQGERVENEVEFIPSVARAGGSQLNKRGPR